MDAGANSAPEPSADLDASMLPPVDAGTAPESLPPVRTECPESDAGINQPCVLRVSAAHGSASGTGESWDTAISDLQVALDAAPCGCELWIAGGTYLPTRAFDLEATDAQLGDARRASFELPAGLTLLGGFAGDELAAEERDPAQNLTLLSGDLGVPGDASDNAYHVLVTRSDAVLEGLTVRDGNADGFGAGNGAGGGLLVVGAEVTLKSVHFENNGANNGAGVYLDLDSTAQVSDCEFTDNHCQVGGGLLISGAGPVVVERTRFLRNAAPFSGGGIHQGAGELRVTDSYFSENRSDFGPAISVTRARTHIEAGWFEGNVGGAFGGSVFARLGADVQIKNSVIAHNTSIGHGGALAVWTASMHVTNSTIFGNYALFGGALLIKDGSEIELENSIIWNNTDNDGHALFLEGESNSYSASSSIVSEELAGAGNLVLDPGLANAPVLTRFANRAATVAQVNLVRADETFAVGDLVELGDDGVARTVTEVSLNAVLFTPELSEPSPRFMRVDLWPRGHTDLTLNLRPGATSPAVDRAASAPATDVSGQPRIDVAGVACDVGAPECSIADLGGMEYVP